MKPRLWRALVVIPLVFGGVAVVDAPAHAIPSNCHTGPIYGQPYYPIGAWGQCYSGSGSFRVKVKCRQWIAGPYTLYGGWRYSTPSEVTCFNNDLAYDPVVETRST